MVAAAVRSKGVVPLLLIMCLLLLPVCVVFVFGPSLVYFLVLSCLVIIWGTKRVLVVYLRVPSCYCCWVFVCLCSRVSSSGCNGLV